MPYKQCCQVLSGKEECMKEILKLPSENGGMVSFTTHTFVIKWHTNSVARLCKAGKEGCIKDILKLPSENGGYQKDCTVHPSASK
jgi:hypothetical protein